MKTGCREQIRQLYINSKMYAVERKLPVATSLFKIASHGLFPNGTVSSELRSLGQMRLALLNSRLQRDRFGDHLPEEIV